MIYLLEDDESIRKLVIYTLEHSGYSILGFEFPSDFWQAMEQSPPELVLLDIMLPEEDGLTVLRRIRQSARWNDVPVIMMTARNTEYDRVVGLDAGADDYISKPFGMMELVARVRAMLRRSDKGKSPDSGVLTAGPISVYPDEFQAKVGDRALSLTRKEFELLRLFLERPGQVLTRDAIMDRVWGSSFDGENRTVDVHIRSLRAKLMEEGDRIETVRGIGYRMGKQP